MICQEMKYPQPQDTPRRLVQPGAACSTCCMTPVQPPTSCSRTGAISSNPAHMKKNCAMFVHTTASSPAEGDIGHEYQAAQRQSPQRKGTSSSRSRMKAMPRNWATRYTTLDTATTIALQARIFRLA